MPATTTRAGPLTGAATTATPVMTSCVPPAAPPEPMNVAAVTDRSSLGGVAGGCFCQRTGKLTGWGPPRLDAGVPESQMSVAHENVSVRAPWSENSVEPLYADAVTLGPEGDSTPVPFRFAVQSGQKPTAEA